MKTTVAFGTLGPLPTRFVPGGYWPDLSQETSEERISRAVEGLAGHIDGYEFYYPDALNEGNFEAVTGALRGHDVYILANALHPDPLFARGGLSSPDSEIRAEAMRRTRGCIELAGTLGAAVIIWPGTEGYNYPFQIHYAEAWSLLIDALDEAAAECERHKIDLLLEPKSSEPALKVLLRDSMAALYVVRVLRDRGHHNVKVNLDWQNVFMTGQSLAESAALLEAEGALGHLHASSGWGILDDKTMVGSLKFMESLELAYHLSTSGYAQSGGRLGFDIYPYTEDGIAAVRQSVEQWRALERIAGRIDATTLEAARSGRDVIPAQQAVFAALTGD